VTLKDRIDRIERNKSAIIVIILGLTQMAISYFMYDEAAIKRALGFALGVAVWFTGLMLYDPRIKEAET